MTKTPHTTQNDRTTKEEASIAEQLLLGIGTRSGVVRKWRIFLVASSALNACQRRRRFMQTNQAETARSALYLCFPIAYWTETTLTASFMRSTSSGVFAAKSSLIVPFLARDSIYAIARYMPSPVRLSVCPSHGWISQRRLKLGSRNLHHRVAPWL